METTAKTLTVAVLSMAASSLFAMDVRVGQTPGGRHCHAAKTPQLRFN